MWSTREDFVSVVVGQAPMLTPLFRRSFWVEAGYATEKSSSPLNGRRNFGDDNGYELNEAARAVVTIGGGPQSRRKARDPYSITQIENSESQEEIIKKNAADMQNGSKAADSAINPKTLDGRDITVRQVLWLEEP